MATAINFNTEIPDKYSKTGFTKACYLYLSRNPQLTLSQFRQEGRRNKDTFAVTCRESIFEEIKREMGVERVLNGNHITEGLRNADEEEKILQNGHHKNGAHKPLALQAALIKATVELRPNTEAFREQATDWILMNPTSSYVGFKHFFPENFLNLSFFEAQKRKIKPAEEPAEAPAAATPHQTDSNNKGEQVVSHKKPDARVGTFRTGSEMGRIKSYLLTLPAGIRAAMKQDEYEMKTGHRIKSRTVFSQTKIALKKLYGAAAPITAPPPPPAGPAASAQPIAMGGRSFRIMAELTLQNYGGVQPSQVQKIAKDLAVALLGPSVKIVMLSEPAMLEVRLPE